METVTWATEFSHATAVAFAELSGDHNPLHLSEEAAAASRFGRPVVHGALLIAHVSGGLASRLPGPGTIYLRQDMKFLHPVFWGDVEFTLTKSSVEKKVWQLRTTVSQGGTCCAEGTATVLAPDE